MFPFLNGFQNPSNSKYPSFGCRESSWHSSAGASTCCHPKLDFQDRHGRKRKHCYKLSHDICMCTVPHIQNLILKLQNIIYHRGECYAQKPFVGWDSSRAIYQNLMKEYFSLPPFLVHHSNVYKKMPIHRVPSNELLRFTLFRT